MKKLLKKEMILVSLLTFGCLVGCNEQSSSPTDGSAPVDSGSVSADVSSLIDFTDLSVRDAIGKNGVVAAANPYAAQAGIEVLKAGGNAFEAAVAVSFALGVVEPHASGVGGGGILVGFNASKGEFVSYNFREFVPGAGTVSNYTEATLDNGIKSSGVPTQVAGLLGILQEEASGNVTRQQVMAPAIDYAENGVVITPELANTISDCYANITVCPEETSEVFDDGIEPLKAGDMLIQKNYAKTLTRISEQGLDGFYKGETAKAILDLQEKHGGLITQADLDRAAEMFPIKATPVQGNYRGYDIVSSTTPSSGGTILVEALNMLEHYGDISLLKHNSAEYIHVVASALQLSYGDKRKYIADQNFVDVPLSGLLSKQYAADRWDECFNPDSAWLGKYGDAYGGCSKAPTSPWNYCTDTVEAVEDDGYAGLDNEEHYSTTAFSVCDKEGNIVSITQTINHFWGNSLIPAGCGFFMNNQLSSFSLSATSASYVQPYKQPVSHIMPTIILKDGDPFATLGSPGSMRIPTAVTLTVINLIDFGMDIQSAIEAPRFFSYAISASDAENTGGAIEYGDDGANKKWIEIEGGIDPSVIEALQAKNYYVDQYEEEVDLYFGGVQGITFNAQTGEMHGGADIRRDGKALGY